jgi:nucleoporin POM152
MNATPRVRSGAFPQTPATRGRGAPPTPSPSPPNVARRAPLPVAAAPPRGGKNGTNNGGSRPVIPLTIIDAPAQRFYAFAVYGILLAWRIYDWLQLAEDNAESFWLFLKWVFIDLVYLFGLPELRIPWLEITPPTVIALVMGHAIINWMLMFNIPLPFTSWLLGVAKVFFDKELSTSERYIGASNILRNSSLIQGRQIINILPEGFAVLNPDATPFCIGGDKKVASVPVLFNATIPVEVELIRTDLDTGIEETVSFKRSEIREIERLVKRQHPEGKAVEIQYNYNIKKAGAYHLGKVLDEYRLQVQRKSPFTYVVTCPTAKVAPSPSSARCVGDLSDLSLQVDGTPPLKIVYSRMVNGKDHSFHFQSLQPEGYSSPLLGNQPSSALILPDMIDTSWARSQRVTVGLNESMHAGGEWQYSIDEVQDAFGNVVKYGGPADELDMRPKPKHLAQTFLVKERPRIRLQGCDLRNPLKVAKNKAINLPVNVQMPGTTRDDGGFALAWNFSPIDTLTNTGDHGDVITVGTYKARNANERPTISAPGLYTLTSVSSGACEGEVQEPSSCLLLNPLEPNLTLRSEEIPDTCAGNSIGLRVDLDMVGTPPFIVRYDVTTNGETRHDKVNIPGMRFQLELIPRVAGHHKYTFRSVDDAVYRAQPLSGPEMTLQQSVKPAATALFSTGNSRVSACLEESVSVDVALLGEPPFTLEYELLHEGKREQFKAAGIETTAYRIETPKLGQGGEYALALTSVQDQSGCRNFVQDEIKISVTRQRPRASFGLIDNKRTTMVVEDAKVRLPLRLTGEGPWKLSYRLGDEDAPTVQRTLTSGNDFIDVSERGVYKIWEVSDKQCRGIVDPGAATFEVGWFRRPELQLVQSDTISSLGNSKYTKKEVCEGDLDGFELTLQGISPLILSDAGS